MEGVAIPVRLSFLSKVMAGAPVAPLTHDEQALRGSREALTSYQRKGLIPDVVSSLSAVREKVDTGDMARFLVYAAEREQHLQAALVLEAVDMGDMLVPEHLLYRMLRDEDGIGPLMSVEILGETPRSRPEPRRPGSSIDREAMDRWLAGQ